MSVLPELDLSLQVHLTVLGSNFLSDCKKLKLVHLPPNLVAVDANFGQKFPNSCVKCDAAVVLNIFRSVRQPEVAGRDDTATLLSRLEQLFACFENPGALAKCLLEDEAFCAVTRQEMFQRLFDLRDPATANLRINGTVTIRVLPPVSKALADDDAVHVDPNQPVVRVDENLSMLHWLLIKLPNLVSTMPITQNMLRAQTKLKLTPLHYARTTQVCCSR